MKWNNAITRRPAGSYQPLKRRDSSTLSFINLTEVFNSAKRTLHLPDRHYFNNLYEYIIP